MDNYKTIIDETREIVFVYIKDFKWYHKPDQEMLEGHPLVGRIYRAVKDTKNNIYYLRFDQVSPAKKEEFGILGIAIHGQEEDLPGSFYANVEELNKDNILDLTIETEDFNNLSEWVETDNKDFVEYIKTHSYRPHPMASDNGPDLKITVKGEISDGEKEAINKLIKAITEDRAAEVHEKAKRISFLNPMILDALSNYLDHVANVELGNDPVMQKLSDEVSTHQSLGKGANIYTAIANLDDYMHTNLGGNRKSVYAAIDALIREIVRLNMNGK